LAGDQVPAAPLVTPIQPITSPRPTLTVAAATPIRSPSPKPQPSASRVDAFAFLDADYGWLAVDRTLLLTEDGGRHWRAHAILPGPTISLDFMSRRHGWALTRDGRVVATYDGGLTWQPITTPATIEVGMARLVEARSGWAAGRAAGTQPDNNRSATVLIRTDDDGATWREVPLPCRPDKYNGARVSFVSRSVVWVACGNFGQPLMAGQQVNEAHRTVDGGATWQLILPAALRGWIPAIHFISDMHGWVGQGRYPALLTRDGGRMWEEDHGFCGSHCPHYNHHFITPKVGFAHTTGDGLVGTRDGGETWRKIDPVLSPGAESSGAGHSAT
jgi:photosystem II stability/assembly factor-like uncharacterized protein